MSSTAAAVTAMLEILKEQFVEHWQHIVTAAGRCDCHYCRATFDHNDPVGYIQGVMKAAETLRDAFDIVMPLRLRIKDLPLGVHFSKGSVEDKLIDEFQEAEDAYEVAVFSVIEAVRGKEPEK